VSEFARLCAAETPAFDGWLYGVEARGRDVFDVLYGSGTVQLTSTFNTLHTLPNDTTPVAEITIISTAEEG